MRQFRGAWSSFMTLIMQCKKYNLYSKCSLRGSSPRPRAHKTIALTTELREPFRERGVLQPTAAWPSYIFGLRVRCVCRRSCSLCVASSLALWCFWPCVASPPRVRTIARRSKMDTLGFEPRAFRMRSGCDTTTPCAHLASQISM